MIISQTCWPLDQRGGLILLWTNLKTNYWKKYKRTSWNRVIFRIRRRKWPPTTMPFQLRDVGITAWLGGMRTGHRNEVNTVPCDLMSSHLKYLSNGNQPPPFQSSNYSTLWPCIQTVQLWNLEDEFWIDKRLHKWYWIIIIIIIITFINPIAYEIREFNFASKIPILGRINIIFHNDT